MFRKSSILLQESLVLQHEVRLVLQSLSSWKATGADRRPAVICQATDQTAEPDFKALWKVQGLMSCQVRDKGGARQKKALLLHSAS